MGKRVAESLGSDITVEMGVIRSPFCPNESLARVGR